MGTHKTVHEKNNQYGESATLRAHECQIIPLLVSKYFPLAMSTFTSDYPGGFRVDGGRKKCKVGTQRGGS